MIGELPPEQRKMNRPVIGISGYVDHARWDIWDTEATIISKDTWKESYDAAAAP